MRPGSSCRITAGSGGSRPYYERDGHIISIYDSVILVIIVALVVLLLLTDMQELSFITGLVVGMLIIQIFFHRFDKPLAPEQAPESEAPPRKITSYAIQADPALAWREIVVMTALFAWGALRARPRARRLARLLVSDPHKPRAQFPKPSNVARPVEGSGPADHRMTVVAIRPAAGSSRCANGSCTRGADSYWSAATMTIGPSAVWAAGLFTVYLGSRGHDADQASRHTNTQPSSAPGYCVWPPHLHCRSFRFHRSTRE